ncbi:NAD(P)-dependent oxidoreductase [Arthrobacter sp. NamB2]|uniref:NAD(P)-dependent oxidoreductase n=1 Tax=Arthrobacter sp. NamB2 TaxID=2576035 RepID=UPI0010CA07B5|nr:NAD(P)-dependent oxidoreductase [Arthrobacter sp. NamB2]TKV28821.1 NAD(P)-dependent oxidoreductase [Arthrobacter sp. NamB2]
MATKPRTTTIGLAGLGNLGLPMAHALLDDGWPLTVFDPAPDKARSCVDAGAKSAESVEELASADVLVLVVPDDAAVESILLGERGYFATSTDGAVIVHSTILPASAQSLAAAAREHGTRFIDAPVSGGSARARKGDLTVFVGAEREDFDAVEDVVRAVGSEVLLAGAPGTGAATKLANQMMMFSALAGAHEALDVAGKYGVAPETVLKAVATSTGASWVAANWGFFDDTAAAYSAGGTAVKDRPWSKDLFEFLTAARTAETSAPFAALLSQLLPDYVESHARDAAAGEGHDHDGKDNDD